MKKFFLLPFLFLPFACTESGPAPIAEERCLALLAGKCRACHLDSERICEQLGKKSRTGWENSINNMVRHGAELNEKEIELAVACLLPAKPGADFVCGE